jgi:hypothetical protein
MHYRTWLFYKVDRYRFLSLLMNASGVIQVLLGTLGIIFVFAKCTPVQAKWDLYIEGKCWNQNMFLGFNYTSSALTFVSYMIQAWVPLHPALSLQKWDLSKGKWIMLAVLAFWNVVAGVLALVKLGFMHLYFETVDPSKSPRWVGGGRAVLVGRVWWADCC